MTFVSIGHELYRVVNVYTLYRELHVVLVNRDGLIHADYLHLDSSVKWEFHTGSTAELMTLIFGNEYFCQIIPNQYRPSRSGRPVGWVDTDNEIIKTIPESLVESR